MASAIIYDFTCFGIITFKECCWGETVKVEEIQCCWGETVKVEEIQCCWGVDC